jgi:hypothetical protein
MPPESSGRCAPGTRGGRELLARARGLPGVLAFLNLLFFATTATSAGPTYSTCADNGRLPSRASHKSRRAPVGIRQGRVHDCACETGVGTPARPIPCTWFFLDQGELAWYVKTTDMRVSSPATVDFLVAPGGGAAGADFILFHLRTRGCSEGAGAGALAAPASRIELDALREL